MNLANLLSIINVTHIGDLGGVTMKYQWLLNVISWFIGLVADVGVGIMLFTLALKLITLPLDIISRASMKKNALKMEMMRDDLEKLQKQYANNKQLYQQKMMALYKKNGYSAFSACLPTIVTLVFFFIVIGAFNSYSKKTDFEVFEKMGAAYDSKLNEYVIDENSAEEGAVIRLSNGYYAVNIDYVMKAGEYDGYFTADLLKKSYDTDKYILKSGLTLADIEKLGIKDYFAENSVDFDYENAAIKSAIRENALDKYIRESGLADKYYKADDENSAVKLNENGKYYFYDSDKIDVSDIDEKYVENGKFSIEKFNSAEIAESEKKDYANRAVSLAAVKNISDAYINENVAKEARKAAAETYEKDRSKSVVFFWVKNLWVVDSPFSPAIPAYSKLSSTLYGKNGSAAFTEDKYNELTAELDKYKQTGFGKGNGYFILVALSILTMLGSTIIMNKTQKTQMELSTVDGANGQAAMQQKMMTWMMPIMFGIFAFIYSAGFSIYMVTSSILSTCFTLLINLCVEKSFKRKIQKEVAVKNEKPRYGKRR